MAETLNSKRVFFPNGEQRQFLLLSKETLNVSWKDIADIAGITVRNLSDWRNEKISMTFRALRDICRKRRCPMPKNIEIRDAYWYVSKGAKAGGEALLKRYGHVGGDEEYRKKKWQEWWEREGRLDPVSITKPASFRKPKHSVALAEFVGIMLGDGGISEYQLTITLHRITDRKYSLFVRKLIADLFRIKAGISRDADALADTIVISRVGIVRFCTEVLGLKKGNKVRQQVDIPEWVKKKRLYAIACLRGLIDTDGCVIIHQYRSKGKLYSYRKIGYTSRSLPLLTAASRILSELGIGHRLTRSGYDIRIEAMEEVKKYFRIVGTSNPKHQERYSKA